MLESFVMPSFRNHLPVQIHFSEGISGMLPNLLSAEGVSRAALINDDGLLNFNTPTAKVLSDTEASGATADVEVRDAFAASLEITKR